jgi:hypothetical protein
MQAGVSCRSESGLLARQLRRNVFSTAIERLFFLCCVVRAATMEVILIPKLAAVGLVQRRTQTKMEHVLVFYELGTLAIAL